MKKRNWYLPVLNRAQAEKLMEALKRHFHFYLLPQHIGWQPRKKILWVMMDSDPHLEQVGIYINGFHKALE